ncbi:unnamed protein product [Notodromas monacha]|uniref:Nudix hydrolase domain-containing protein n=1 Tax=Notodromas monacha TaxID=399045 RepID=A0A7R9BR33_9CRUS|nr:unnamed protein product [Notodromas monacha]CAG0919804.1 unnamed protein product [Notodromas monacha]
MESVAENVVRLLDGQAVEESKEFCDFSLHDQNSILASRGISSTVPDSFKPVLKKSVVYIVMATLINDDGDILMMQEAKSRCAGQWYLPAGRMEPGESIVDAVKREVNEETGLTFDPTTLLMIECAAGSWFRFALTGKVTGGELKVPAKADSESLQAKFVKDLGELSLRSGDMTVCVDKVREHHTNSAAAWHPDLLPIAKMHTMNLLRILCIVRKKSTNKVHVLVSEKTEAHIPACEINPTRSLHATLKKYMTEIFGSTLPPHKPHGVLTLEHQPGDVDNADAVDGLCLTLLVSIRCALEEAHPIDKYTWLEVPDALGKRLLRRLDRNLTVPLNVIRTWESDA